MNPHNKKADKELNHRVYQSLVAQAHNGDRNSADGLLAVFSELAKNPSIFDGVGGIPTPLLQHVAACIADWRKRNYEDAATWFLVNRPAHSPDQTSGAHVAAMRAYLLVRARGKGTAAAKVSAANYSGLTEGQVRHLIDKDKPPKTNWYAGRAIGGIEFAALFQINQRLHERVLNPPRKKYQKTR